MPRPPAPDLTPAGPLLTPREAAAMFAVDPKTVARWARKGLISSGHTPTGQRRYSETELRALLARPDACPWCANPLGSPGHKRECGRGGAS